MVTVSGDDAPSKGTWKIVGPRGGEHGEVHVKQRGDTMPPTDKPNQHFEKKK